MYSFYYCYGESTSYVDESAYEYGYDRDSIGILQEVNPITYWGYYRDEETSFYYLQSRYYLPTFGRFVNTDAPIYAQAQKDDFAGINLFAYCYNNPVNYTDESGNSATAGIAISLIIETIVELLIESVSAIAAAVSPIVVVAITVIVAAITATFAAEHKKIKENQHMINIQSQDREEVMKKRNKRILVKKGDSVKNHTIRIILPSKFACGKILIWLNSRYTPCPATSRRVNDF